MKKVLFILITFFGLMSFTYEKAHDFYVSITEIELKQDFAQISMRVFTDDLEYALKKENSEPFYLNRSSDFEKNQHAISKYLNQRFSLVSASKAHTIEWIGHEIEEDVIWIYGETAILKTTLLEIKNSVLMDYFEDQQNMIHLKRADGFDSKLCSKRSSTIRFSLEQ